jgi:hypothetical protein
VGFKKWQTIHLFKFFSPTFIYVQRRKSFQLSVAVTFENVLTKCFQNNHSAAYIHTVVAIVDYHAGMRFTGYLLAFQNLIGYSQKATTRFRHTY